MACTVMPGQAGSQAVREWAFPLRLFHMPTVETPVVSTVPSPVAVSVAVTVEPESPPAHFPLSILGFHGIDRERLAQMAGKPEVVPMMLRSLSVIVSRTAADRTFGVLNPEVQVVANSALPWSSNDGDLWAGKGTNTRFAAGFFARFRSVQLVVAPELTSMPNDTFELRKPIIERPTIPPDRSQFSLPWYVVGPYSVDMPTRFGNESMTRFSLGQSSILIGFSKLQLGFANENEWWG
ncbi:MAG: hypothetical protein Q7R41_16535, partial [Phycisphaerales bacterium]|nr:hypothetical protein [Phycisphaerales bacterium]